MNKGSLKIILIIIVTLVIISTAILLFIIIPRADNKDGEKNIREIDNLINSGFYQQAVENIDKSYEDIKSSKQALIFLKRCFILSEKLENYKLLQEYSGLLYNRFKRNIEIAYIYAYSLAVNENYEKSFDLSYEKLRKTDYKQIYYYNSILNNTILENEDLIFQQELSSMNLEKLNELHSSYPDERFYVDAALLAAEEGNFNKAAECLNKTDQNNFSELKMLISYDAGNYKNAEKFYEAYLKHSNCRNTLYRLLGSDIYYRNNKKNDAELNYQAIINEFPDFSSLPYRNLYSLNYENNKRNNFLDLGLKSFPDNVFLNQAAIWELYRNNIDNVQTVSSRIAEQSKDLLDDPYIKLLEVEINRGSRNPEHVISNLWILYNSNPESENIAKYFANYLLHNNRTDTLKILLEKYVNNNKEEEWILSYKAVSAALKGNFNNAVEILKKALILNESFTVKYNLAVILLLAENYQEALDVLKNVKTNDIEQNEEYTAMYHLKLAECYFYLHDPEPARFYALQSLELKPDNFSGELLLNKIQEEYYD